MFNTISVLLGSYFYVNLSSFFDSTKQIKKYLKKSSKQKTLYQQGLEAEEQLFVLSGLNVKQDLKIFNVNIDNEKNAYIHTVNFGNKKKPAIVLLHGYWSGNPTFLKLLKPLGPFFNIYLIDLLGFGLSSRTEFNCQTPDETINYFIDSLDKWREVMGIQKFTLLGISFGGYISVNYALKYEQHLDKLLLLSPLGLCKGKDPASKTNKHQGIVYFIFEGNKIWRQIYYSIFSQLWDHTTVSGIYQKKWFPLSHWLLDSYLKQWTNPAVDKEKWRQYYDKIMKLPVTAEQAMQKILYFPSFCVMKPLQDFMSKITVPCHFFYGDNDWMEREVSKELIENQSIKGTYTIVKGSGHMLTYDQPETLCEKFKELRII